jgi:hypothetical protein
MAAERRSLADGLDQIGGVDLETARAFIVQEKPREVKPAPVAPVLIVADPQPMQPAEQEKSAEAARGGEKSAPPVATKRPSKPAVAKRPDTARILSTLLVPVTIRLRPEVAAALKHASLQRQLNGVETYTQQDIVEEALVPWLQAEGLLD